MRCLIIASLAVGLVLPAVVSAGGAANPAFNVGKENLGFTFEIENQVKNLGEDQATSKRWLGKIIWGATEKLDVYARLGASDLKIAVEGAQDYQGKRGMTWGGGLRYLVAAVPEPKVKTYIDAQMLSFYTRGDVWRDFEEGYTEKYADRYKWNELQLSFFGVWERDIFAPYVGFGITNVFGRVTKDVYRIAGGVGDLYQRDAYDFREDAIPEMILGVDIGLGGTGHLSGELRFSDQEDISFFVGASELWRPR
jgi:hypothetical protein